MAKTKSRKSPVLDAVRALTEAVTKLTTTVDERITKIEKMLKAGKF